MAFRSGQIQQRPQQKSWDPAMGSTAAPAQQAKALPEWLKTPETRMREQGIVPPPAAPRPMAAMPQTERKRPDLRLVKSAPAEAKAKKAPAKKARAAPAAKKTAAKRAAPKRKAA